VSLKNLRTLIRKIIFESQNNRVRKGVANSPVDLKLDDRGLSADQRALGGIKGKYGAERILTKEEQMDHAITHMPEYKNSQNLRAVIKRWWNDRVYGNSERAQYFSNPNKIKCIHWLGFYEEDPEVAISKLETYLSPAGKRVPELSTIGYLNDRYIWRLDKSIGIEYKKRTITFAYSWDAFTEFLSSATPEIEQIHRGSGVHKRPNTLINIDNVVFDERDVERMRLKRINECIIDNYDNSPENVVIHVNPELNDEHKKKIENVLKSYSPNYIIRYN